MTNDDLYDLDDAALAEAFKSAKAEIASPDTTYEDNEDADTEEVDDLEQPDDQESDDDTSSDDEEEGDTEEESEGTDSELDEDAEESEDDLAEVDTKSKTKEQPVQKRKYKANGQSYEFTDEEIFNKFGEVFGKAMDYTKKTKALKERRKTLDILDQTGIRDEDLSLFADVLKGDKDAIASILKRTGVDALDIDTENANYIAKDYGRNDTELEIKDIFEEISSDREYSITQGILQKQWDDASRESFVQEPTLIKLLHEDVKSGMFDKVNPIAQKLKVYDNGRHSDLDYYKEAAKQYFSEQNQQVAKQNEESQKVAQVKAKQAKQVAVKQDSSKRKSAAPSSKRVGTTKRDYLDDNDDAFEDWYNKLQEAR